MEYVIVFVTASNAEEAEKIAKTLVEERLVACVNIVPRVRSIYRWEGAIESTDETFMVAKTERSLFDAVARRVKELHSYTVPEVIALPLVAGSHDYLCWIGESVRAEK